MRERHYANRSSAKKIVNEMARRWQETGLRNKQALAFLKLLIFSEWGIAFPAIRCSKRS